MIGERTGPARRKESGPALEGTPARTTLPQHPTSASDNPAPLGVVTALPLRWAKALIDGCTGPIPKYDSPEWHALPDDSREKAAGCVIAAECWRIASDPEEIALRLRIELDALRAEDEAPGQWTPEVVASVHRSARQPSYATLSGLRDEPEAEARANDHRRRMGLPVARGNPLRLVPDPVDLPSAPALDRGAYAGGRVAWDEAQG